MQRQSALWPGHIGEGMGRGQVSHTFCRPLHDVEQGRQNLRVRKDTDLLLRVITRLLNRQESGTLGDIWEVGLTTG